MFRLHLLKGWMQTFQSIQSVTAYCTGNFIPLCLARPLSLCFNAWKWDKVQPRKGKKNVKLQNQDPQVSQFPLFFCLKLETEQIYTPITFLNQGQGNISPTSVLPVLPPRCGKAYRRNAECQQFFFSLRFPISSFSPKCVQKVIFRYCLDKRRNAILATNT